MKVMILLKLWPLLIVSPITIGTVMELNISLNLYWMALPYPACVLSLVGAPPPTTPSHSTSLTGSNLAIKPHLSVRRNRARTAPSANFNLEKYPCRIEDACLLFQ